MWLLKFAYRNMMQNWGVALNCWLNKLDWALLDRCSFQTINRRFSQLSPQSLGCVEHTEINLQWEIQGSWVHLYFHEAKALPSLSITRDTSRLMDVQISWGNEDASSTTRESHPVMMKKGSFISVVLGASRWRTVRNHWKANSWAHVQSVRVSCGAFQNMCMCGVLWCVASTEVRTWICCPTWKPRQI